MKANDTIVCIASGPSLTQDDVDMTRGNYTVAANSSWRIAPWCDAVFGGDAAWWRDSGDLVLASRRRKLTCSRSAAQRYGIEFFERPRRSGYNTGQCVVEWAVAQQPERIILLGYDCSLRYGKHWHPDHPRRNPTPELVRNWIRQFDGIDVGDVDVINCSRYTELKKFRKAALEDVL